MWGRFHSPINSVQVHYRRIKFSREEQFSSFMREGWKKIVNKEVSKWRLSSGLAKVSDLLALLQPIHPETTIRQVNSSLGSLALSFWVSSFVHLDSSFRCRLSEVTIAELHFLATLHRCSYEWILGVFEFRFSLLTEGLSTFSSASTTLESLNCLAKEVIIAVACAHFEFVFCLRSFDCLKVKLFLLFLSDSYYNFNIVLYM